MRTTPGLLTISLLALAAGCGSEPVSHSAPVGIELKAESGKAVDGVLSDSKNISTESGNPFGAFIADANEQLGRDPGRVEVAEVSMLLSASSTGVLALGAIFDGRVDVLFEMDDSNDTIPVAHAAIDASVDNGGPLAFELDFDSGGISAGNFEGLLEGKFKVVFRGPIHADFDSLDAKGDLQITFSFEAFE